MLTPLVALLVLATAAAQQRAENLTIGGLPPPVLGLDLHFQPNPVFSWQVTAPQTAYRLVVTTAAGAPLWDSGPTPSARTTQVPYGGPPLPPDADFLATLTATLGASPAPPLVGAFSSGPDAAAWAASAQWLGGCTAALAAPQLRRAFTLSPAPVLRARAYASAAGIFTLHLNGARVGSDALAPGWSTVPTVRLLAGAYDVAPALVPGAENVLGLRLGQGKYGYVHEFCAAGDASCYAGVVRLVITQAGGNTTVIETEAASGAWQCAPSPIVFQHLFDGESYNASLEQAGWDMPNFVPAAPWTPAPPRSPNVTLLTTGVPQITTAASLAPASVAPGPGGGHVIAGGKFIIAASGGNPNVYWWADNTTVKNFVTSCSMCGLEVCGALVPEPPATIAALATGANFSCSQLPTGPGAFVFDLGRNMAGVCTLLLPPFSPALAGATLTLVHGEILSAAGGVDNTFGTSSTQRGCAVNSINCADQLDSYTFGAQPPPVGASFTPSFTFHGFRYVGLFGWPPAPAPAPTLATLTCHQQYSAMEDAGSLTLNSTILNQLQRAVVQTQKSNVFSIPSDCPTREKRGWAGDAQVSVGQAMLNLQAGALYENWVRTMTETEALGCNEPTAPASAALSLLPTDPTPQRPAEYLCCGKRQEFGCQPGLTPLNASGSLPDVVPFDSISGWPGDWVWSTAGVEIPAYLLQHTGNLGFQGRVFEGVWGLLSFAAANTEQGLLRYGPYGDWLGEDRVDTTFVENFYLARAALQGATLASALGYSDRAAALLALSGSVGAALVRDYFDAAHGVWKGAGGMNLQAMGLAGGIGGAATANATGTVIAAMLADAAAKGFHTSSGLASSRWILAGLALAGNSTSDPALAMASNPTSPGWGYMVATADMPGTIWESWGGDAHTSDGSKNHPVRCPCLLPHALTRSSSSCTSNSHPPLRSPHARRRCSLEALGCGCTSTPWGCPLPTSWWRPCPLLAPPLLQRPAPSFPFLRSAAWALQTP
jgi:hypothetical protein